MGRVGATIFDPSEFAAATTKPNRVTINVHVPYEGDLPSTDLSIPFDEIATHVDQLSRGPA